jgi:hypothetical protein
VIAMQVADENVADTLEMDLIFPELELRTFRTVN